MIIPIRTRVDAPITVTGPGRELAPDHPLAERSCPVCDGPLAIGPVVIVLVGIAPEDRKPSGWTTGAGVAVHAECTAPPAD